jgi:ComF family protein
VAYGSYDGGLRELIHLLKYDGVRPAANILGRMLAEALTALEPAFERLTFEQAPILVVPVPLYRAKRRRRGFNHAELIARVALKVYSASRRLQLAPDLLLRTRDTPSQIGLSNHQCRANLRGAFTVEFAADVTGREVIPVDDVYTTGTTASECARVLRRCGSRRWLVPSNWHLIIRNSGRASIQMRIPLLLKTGQKKEGRLNDDRHDSLAKAVGT